MGDDKQEEELHFRYERMRFEQELRQKREVLCSLYGGLAFTALLFPGCGYYSVCFATSVSLIFAIVGIGASIGMRLWNHLAIALGMFGLILYFAIYSKQ